MKIVSIKAPVNIAVIKYWGKRNEDLILPLNDSLSATLSIDQLCAHTTVAISKDFKSDRIWLNGVETDINNKRLQNCLRNIKKVAQKENHDTQTLDYCIHICSKNNFPTAAGLASSAAGYACLVYALGELYNVKSELSVIARQGSGSACRSIYGGFVQWLKGELEDGSDSKAVQIAPESHWPELRVLILVVNQNQKETSSTLGMSNSVATSELLKHRAKEIVPQRTKEITDAIYAKNFETFATLTMKDSNQFHAVCLDSFPPIKYINDISWFIINLVHQFNSFYKTQKLAYTFDAGPNACLFLLEKDWNEVCTLVQHYFKLREESFQGLPFEPSQLSDELLSSIKLTPKEGSIKFCIGTKVGRGPKVVNEHLLDTRGEVIEAETTL